MPVNIGLTREFYQTISLVIFLVVAFGLHGWGERIKQADLPRHRGMAVDPVTRRTHALAC